MQIQITISKEDEIHNDIITSVIGTDQRKAFIKEAIYYWDYILHHTDRISSYIQLKSEEVLFPPLYIDNSNLKRFNSSVHKGNIERSAISVRINISEDDYVLQDIIKRVLVKPEFIKEAIYNWYYAIHNSHLSSYFIELIPNFKKKNYFTLELDSILSEDQIRDIYSFEGNNQTTLLANYILQSLGNNVDMSARKQHVVTMERNYKYINEVSATVTTEENISKDDLTTDENIEINEYVEPSEHYEDDIVEDNSEYEYEDEDETDSIFGKDDEDEEYDDEFSGGEQGF